MKLFEELEFAVVAKLEPEYKHSVDYQIFEIVAHALDGKPMFQEKGATCHPSPVEDIEKAEVYISGHVKWDGCSNWIFPEGYVHFCGHNHAEDLLNVGKILAECWAMTKDLCPHWLY